MRHLSAPLFALALALPALAQEDRGPRVNVDVDDVPLARLMAQIARQAKVNIVVDPAIQEKISVCLRDIEWRECADVAARMARCRTEDLPGGVVWVRQPIPITLAGTDLDGRRALQLIARSAGQPLLVLPGVQGRVPALDLKEVDWPDALRTVAEALGAAIHRFDGVVVVAPKDLAPPAAAAQPPEGFSGGPPVNVDVEGQDLQDVCEQVGRAVEKNVLVDPVVSAQVSVTLRNVPWKDAVVVLARLTRCEIEERPGGIVILTRSPANTIQARSVPLPQLLQLLAPFAGKNLTVAAGDYPAVSLDLSGVHWAGAIRLVTWGYGATLEERDNDVLAVGPGPAGAAGAARADDAIGRLVDALERAARSGDLRAVQALSRQLEDLARLGDRAPDATPPVILMDTEDLALEARDLLREITGLAEADDVPALTRKLADWRQLVARDGLEGAGVARRQLGAWEPRLRGRGEVAEALRLTLDVEEANLLLAAMLEAKDPAGLDRAATALKALVAAMRKRDRDVFHRNADAIEARLEAAYREGDRRQALARLPLRVQAIAIPPLADGVPAALLSGVVVREGDPVPGAPGVTVARIRPSQVTIAGGGVLLDLGLKD